MQGLFRTAAVATALVVLQLGTVVVASADTVVRHDPVGDSTSAKQDIVSVRVTYDRRIRVATRFVRLRHGSVFFATLDPGRRHAGGLFELKARQRADGTTAGLLAFAEGEAAGFTRVRCAGLRTSSDPATEVLRVSAPQRCLRRHAPLRGGAWVQVEAGASRDFLPEPPHAFRVSRG
ncbi:hypothetical protein ACT8ZV_16880 [Nocardioides sp. MAHUQ-72]|uniref:hypothetical protein n=1 Tax=unclassified Nocardioides TaxID=2615069 RepID=UPI003619E551